VFVPPFKKDESTAKPFDPNATYPTPIIVKKEEPKEEEIKKTIEKDEILSNNQEKTLVDDIPEPVEFNFESKDNNICNEESQIVIEEPLKEETSNTKFEVKEELKEEKPHDSEYDIHFIEEVLNNANKNFKEKMISELEDANHESKGRDLHKYVKLLDGGTIVASSENSFIITFKEVGHCNLIMKEENADGVIKFIKEYLNYTMNFIALPSDLWKSLSDEYVRIYRMQGSNGGYIHLTKIDYPDLRISKKETKKEEDDQYKGIVDLFGDDLSVK